MNNFAILFLKVYPKGSKKILFVEVIDCYKMETVIKHAFKKKFKQMKEYGREYFNGDISEMMIEFNNLVNSTAVGIKSDPQIGHNSTAAGIKSDPQIGHKLTISNKVNSDHDPKFSKSHTPQPVNKIFIKHVDQIVINDSEKVTINNQYPSKTPKKFFCQYCHSGFTRKDSLNRHQKTTGDTPVIPR